MSTLSKLFSGYTGGGHTAKNGKFSTTKNNHNCNKYGRSTVMYCYSIKYLKYWLGEKYMKVINDYHGGSIRKAINFSDKKPSYMNPKYHMAYHQPKRAYR